MPRPGDRPGGGGVDNLVNDDAGNVVVESALVLDGEDYHGQRTLIIPAAAGYGMNTGGTALVPMDASTGDYNGRWKANAIGDIYVCPLLLRPGDRVISAKFRVWSTAGSNARYSFCEVVAAGTKIIIATDLRAGGAYRDEDLGVPAPKEQTLTNALVLQYRAGAINDRILFSTVVIDRPKP